MAGKGSVKRNIYKLDDYCLTVSYVLIVPLLFKALGYLPYLGLPVETIRPLSEKLSKDFLFLAIFIISILFLQIVGRTVRKKEKILQKLIDIIMDAGTITYTDLARATGLEISALKRLVSDIEKHNGQYIETTKDSVGIKMGEKVEITNKCSTCGASFTHSVSIDTVSLKCGYCGAPVESEVINNAKEGVFRRSQEKADMLKEPKKLNVVVLIFLFIVFWPGAVIYMAMFYFDKNKDNMLLEQMKSRFNIDQDEAKAI
jgi:DNA-directed RNA polymerase subunit RPC12/RpoP